MKLTPDEKILIESRIMLAEAHIKHALEVIEDLEKQIEEVHP